MMQNQDILSESGRFDLLEFLNRDGIPLFAFDFDGTLSAIVDDPNAALIAASVFRKLEELGRRAKVVVLTGRALEDVKNRLPKTISVIVGSHGFEGHSLVSQKDLDCAFDSTRSWIESLGTLGQKYRRNRFWIEDKKYSLCVHYRETKTYPLFSSLISEFKSLVPDARFVLGKRVINLLPKGLPNKLDALRHVMQSLSRNTAFFIGDDVTDEDVFLDKSSDIFSVKVGFDSVLSASYYLHKQDDIEFLLDLFLAVIDSN